jgi:hypothetical protein
MGQGICDPSRTVKHLHWHIVAYQDQLLILGCLVCSHGEQVLHVADSSNCLAVRRTIVEVQANPEVLLDIGLVNFARSSDIQLMLDAYCATRVVMSDRR